MSDYIVIYDQQKEIAAIVDPENRIAFGPAMIGPDAGELLDAFVQSVPYDVAEVHSAVLRGWFEQFAQSYLQAREAKAAASSNSKVESDSAAGVADAARAETEAQAAAGEPPAPQPSDTDMEADESAQRQVILDAAGFMSDPVENGSTPPPYTGPCFACDGQGTIVMVAGEPPVLCSACRGTRRLPASVQA